MKRVLLLVTAVVFLCAFFTPALSISAQEYLKGDFSLYDGQMGISDSSWQFNSQEQELFSAAAIKVKGGKVTMEASVPYTDTFEYGTASGTMSIGGEGLYDEQAGTISGTFSYTNNGSSAADDLNATLTSSCQGTFSTPPISSDQVTVTVSFTGTLNATTTVGGVAIPASQNWSRDVVYKLSVDSGIRFSDLSGNVDVLLPGAEEDDWRRAKLDMPLPYGTLIRTGVDSSAVLSFPGEMNSFVMKPETIINLGDKPEEPNNIEILMGNVWANVKRMIETGGMKVEMSQAVAGIKGTVFSLEEDGSVSRLKVFEGTVEFESKATGESVQVEAGQTIYADVGGLGEIEDFNAAAEMAEWEALGAEFSTAEEEKSQLEEEGNGLPSWIYIVIAAAAVLVLGGALLLVLKRSRAKKGTAAS